MRIVICDDNQDMCEELYQCITGYFQKYHYPEPETVIYNNGTDLLNDKKEMGIVFLDIMLPGLNGIQIGKELKKRNSHTIIFIVTAFDEYLDDAMDIQVFRFITKPIDKQRFFKNMHYAVYQYFVRDRRVAVESGAAVYSVRMSDIICIQSNPEGSGVILHTVQGNYKTLQGLSQWEKILDSEIFFRPHRSNIINMEYVFCFDKEEIQLYDGRFTAYMARREFSRFKKKYIFFLESQRW